MKNMWTRNCSNTLFIAVAATIIVLGLLTTVVYGETHEMESNDTVLTANEIAVGSTMTGNMNSGSDKDWYKFTTPSDGVVNISFSHQSATSGNGWYVYLYKYNPNTLETTEIINLTSSRSTTYITTQNIGLPAGTYYLKVMPSYNLNSLNMDYLITPNFSASNTWEKEFNDDINSANQISLGISYAGSIRSAYRDDWFKFTIPQSGKVVVDFKHQIEDSGNGWNIYLYMYNPSTFQTTEITTFSSGRDDAFIKTPSIGLPAGTYYIKVESDAETGYITNDYFITANFSSSNAWEKEFNNDRATANPISENVVVNGSLVDSSDDDWYRFTTTTNGLVWLSFQHQVMTGSGGWDISLYKYNPSTFELTELTSVSSYSDDALVNTAKVSLVAGTYYIQVDASSYYNEPTADYMLTALVPPIAPTSPKAISASYTSIKLSWSPVSGATGYAVYRLNSGTSTYSRVSTVTGTSYTDMARITGKMYSYKIYAYKTVGGTNIYSPASAIVSAKPYPSAPAVTVAKASTTSIKVTWSGVSGATKYQIFRATSATGTYSLVYTASSTLRSWTNTGLKVGTTYYYKVRAYHLEGSTNVYGYYSTVKYLKL